MEDIEKKDEIVWTEEALRRVENAPDFVRPGIKKLMVKRAKERGKKVIDSEFLTEIRNESMMLASKRIKKIGFEELKIDAFDRAKEKLKSARKKEVIDDIKDFLAKRTSKNEAIIEKFKQYLEDDSSDLGWTKEARERMERVPPFVREMAMKTIAEEAKKRGYRMITEEFLKEIFNDLIPESVRKTFMIKPQEPSNPNKS
ncbi:MAG: PCP reductase family protein [Nitrospinae bacterium]|nr:PCP reductase family protein [Nitrospinota bacterium]MBI3814966.1 PCP reductase family protein [Nitrospinota bacterium]